MAKLGKPMNLEVKKADCEEDEDLERPSFGGLGFGSSSGKASDHLAEAEGRPGFGRPAFGASENSSGLVTNTVSLLLKSSNCVEEKK